MGNFRISLIRVSNGEVENMKEITSDIFKFYTGWTRI